MRRLQDLKAEIFFEKAINTFLLQDNTDYAEIVTEAYQDYQEEFKKEVSGDAKKNTANRV